MGDFGKPEEIIFTDIPEKVDMPDDFPVPAEEPVREREPDLVPA